MPTIEREQLDDIRARVDMVELVGGRVRLRRAGRVWKGLCPFHTERTPSFCVYPDSGNFVCFGCNKQGDCFAWLIEAEGRTFREAAEELAARAGIVLATPEQSPEEQAAERAKARHGQALRAALEFYREALHEPPGAVALDYLTGRGMSAETIGAWGLGYAPPGDDLLAALAGFGFTGEEMAAAGLASPSRDNAEVLRPHLRGRAIFPLHDRAGALVGFAGRALREGQQPKYVNSPQSALFDKSALLYGLSRAREAIRRTGEVVVVEGYTDVIAAHDLGFANVVAQMGTALTDAQIGLLRGLGGRIVVGLDPDLAGSLATDRALGRLRAVGALNSYVLALPGGQDPDGFLRGGGDWRAAVAQAAPLLRHLIGGLAATTAREDPRAVSAAVASVAPLIRAVGDPIERAAYVSDVAAGFGLDPEVARQAIEGQGSPRPARSATEAPPTGRKAVAIDREAHLIGLVLCHPEVAPEFDQLLDEGDLASPHALAVAELIRDGALDPTTIPGEATRAWAIGARARIAARPAPLRGDPLAEVGAILKVLRATRDETRRASLVALLGEAAGREDYAEVERIAGALRAHQEATAPRTGHKAGQRR